MDGGQILAIALSGVSTAGIVGIFYRLGIYTQKVDGHDKTLEDHCKRFDKVESHNQKQDSEIRVLEQKWSSVAHLP